MKKIEQTNFHKIEKPNNIQAEQQVPYYLLSLEEQADEFINSADGQDFIDGCKKIINNQCKKTKK